MLHLSLTRTYAKLQTPERQLKSVAIYGTLMKESDMYCIHTLICTLVKDTLFSNNSKVCYGFLPFARNLKNVGLTIECQQSIAVQQSCQNLPGILSEGKTMAWTV